MRFHSSHYICCNDTHLFLSQHINLNYHLLAQVCNQNCILSIHQSICCFLHYSPILCVTVCTVTFIHKKRKCLVLTIAQYIYFHKLSMIGLEVLSATMCSIHVKEHLILKNWYLKLGLQTLDKTERLLLKWSVKETRFRKATDHSDTYITF